MQVPAVVSSGACSAVLGRAGVPFGAPNSLLQLFAPCHPESAPANEAFLFDGHLLKTAAPAGGCVDVR